MRETGTTELIPKRETARKRTERTRMRGVGVIGLVLIALLAPSPLPAQAKVVQGKSSTVGTAETEAVARAAMFRLRSPITSSHTLDMCPNAAAEPLRDTIRMAAAEGQTADQIVDGVIERYGEHMRIVPERRGAGLWAWIMPPLAVLLGAGLLTVRLRQMRGRPTGGAVRVQTHLSDADRERLDAALAELDATEEDPG